MIEPRPESPRVILALHDEQGEPWPLHLSADCLRFVGPYRRVQGFNIDAMALFEGVRRAG
jgi:hypothetical protein